MKKIHYLIAFLLPFIITSCTSDEMGISSEVGYLKLDMNTVVTPITRGEVVNDPEGFAPKQLYVEIVNADNEVVMSTEDHTDWKDQKLQLKAGNYTINAHSNGWDGSGSGFDTPYYAGSTTVTIKANTITPATLKCTQANVKVTVNYDQSFIDNFKSAKSTFTSSIEGVNEKVFEMGDKAGQCEKSAYFPVGNLTAKLDVTNNSDKTFSQDNTIENVQARDHYIITYAVASGSLSGVNVVINDETHTYEYTINVGYPSDISIDAEVIPSYVSADITGKVVTTSSAINPSYIALQYRQKGEANWTDVPNSNLTTDNEGNVSCTITGLIATTTYECRINYNDPESGLYGDPVEFTTTAFFSNLKATSYNPFSVELTGTIGEATAAGNITLQWKKENEDTWTSVENNTLTINGTNISYHLEGLIQETNYVFRLMCSDPAIESEEKSFKTCGVNNTQLKNPGFESWYMGGVQNAVAYPNVSGELFWDTSNPGSAGYMKKPEFNVSTQNTSIKYSGNSSIQLKSRYVSIKFAAASVYTGQFNKLVGTKGAMLDWGVPFTDMPTALKGFKQAQPGIVDRPNDATQSLAECPQVGETDHQQIYCALLTEQLHVTNYENDETKSNGYELSTAINWETDPRVIAYGQLTISEADDDWTNFTIPLIYHGYVRQPAYLLIVASSSKYGDYFHGSTSSCLYLDDLELVYDGNYIIE